MSTDLLAMFEGTFAEPLLRQISLCLGEPEDTTRTALHSTGPVLMAGLMQRTSSPSGAGEVFRSVTSDNVDGGIASKLPGMLLDRKVLGSLLESGESLNGLLFGSRTGAVTNALSDVSGLRRNSAMTLLSMTAPILFGLLKKLVAHNDLDAAALASAIRRQRNALSRTGLDDRLAKALGFEDLHQFLAAMPAAASAPAPVQRTRDKPWLPWALAAGIAVFGVLFLVNRTAEHQGAPVGAVQIAEMPVEDVSDSAHVYFESGDASIDAEDRLRLAELATSAQQRDRPLAITGYEDRGTDPASNEALARDRALAVRDELIGQGVREDRIVMDPPRPVTDEEAQRVDIDMR